MNEKRFPSWGVAIALLLLFLLPGWRQSNAQRFTALKLPKAITAGKTLLKAASLSTSVLLNEDFENIDGSDATHPLPDGWTATAANDVAWHSGIVVIDNNQVIGKSGDIYAYLLINNQEASDAWAMSPKFKLEAGTEYVVRFYVMLFSVDDKPEGLKAYIGDAPDASAMTTEIYDSDGAEYEGWEKVEAKFTPDKSGDYYVGLHSQSPEGYGATFIDDVQVIKGGCPIASAAISMDMGNKLDIASSISKDYVISNIGTEPLNVSLQQATQGLEVEGLPATIAAGEQATVKVLLTTGTVGDYKGTVDFATNDPGAPSFQLSVTGKVTEARVSENYHFEDFEAGWPEGWDKYEGIACTAGEGINSSRSTYCQSLTGENWFKTHFIKFGDNPKFVINYKLVPYDMFGLGTAPEVVSKDLVEMRFYVSDDYGATFTEVDSIIPSKGTYITESKDYQKYTVDLAEYAGKTCMIMVETNIIPEADIITQSYDTYFDNIEIGSRFAKDLSAGTLKGDSRLEEGMEGTYTVDVTNLGADTQSNYKVRLADRQGKVLSEVDGEAIESGKTVTATFKWAPETKGAYHLHADVVLDGDEDTQNNQSTEVAVHVISDKQQFSETPLLKSIYVAEPFRINTPGVSQTIYYATEIGTDKATLNSIEYQSNADAAFNTREVSLWVGETDKTDFTDNQIVPVSQLTKVFEGKLHIEAGTNPLVIPFDTPYEYKGKNLVVYATNITSEFQINKTFVGSESYDVRGIYINYTGHEGMTAENPGATVGDGTKEGYPYARFGFESDGAGEIKGRVTDSKGALEGVKVQVKGTEYYVTTDKDGNYSLKNVSVGSNKTLVFSKYGYEAQEVSGLNITDGAVVEKDVVMTSVNTHDVNGQVLCEETKQPIAGAKITLKGYADYTAETDAQGRFTINGVYSSNTEGAGDYQVYIGAAYYQPLQGSLTVEGDDVSPVYYMKEGIYPVRNAKVEADEGKAVVSWDAPMPEFRYDSGVYADNLGFDTNNDNAVFGAAWRHSAKLHEVSWYLSSAVDKHVTVKLYVFGLNPDGTPTKNAVYEEYVPSNDDTWNTYKFDTPLDLPDGFCIALGSTSFLGIGACLPNEEYPLEYGTFWYCSDLTQDDRVPWHEMHEFTEATLMIRAVGEDYGIVPNISAAAKAPVMTAFTESGVQPISKATPDARYAGTPAYTTDVDAGSPLVRNYTVYRLNEGDQEDAWSVAGENVTGQSFTDNALAGLPDGTYQWAVKANYTDSSSESVLTNTITHTPTGIGNMSADKDIDSYIVTDMSGSIVKRGINGTYNNMTQGLAKGIYIVSVKYTDGTTEVKKLLKE